MYSSCILSAFTGSSRDDTLPVTPPAPAHRWPGYLRWVLAGGLIAMTGGAVAADPARGKSLVDANCYRCHDTSVYTRPDRRVTSLDGLKKQVRRCELSLGLKWFDEDINAATGYLNQEFYHFK